MIVFHDITWSNFLGTGNYENAIRLDSQELTIIVGKNGAGKSTILDAISFALYGKPFRDPKKKADIVNSVTKKNCKVEITFTINDEYRVIRGLNPAKFEIFKNGELLPQRGKSADDQKFFEEEILRCNHKAFCQIVVLGKASFKPFLDLTAPERRAIVENILDLEIFTNMRKINTEAAARTKAEIDSLENERVLICDRIRMAKLDIERKENETKTDKEAIAITIAGLRTEEESICFQMDKLGSLDDIYTPGIDKLVHQRYGYISDINGRRESSNRINKEIEFFKNNDSCPTCKQLIDSSFKTKSISEANAKIAEYGEQIRELTDKISKIDTRIESGREKLDDLNLKKAEYNKLQIRLSVNENSIKSYKKALEEKIEYLDHQDKITLENLEKSLADNSELLDPLYKRHEAQKVLARMLKDDGVKSMIIGENIETINDLINNYLYNMDFLCKLTLDGNFDETIKSRYRDVLGYGSFSEGEKLRITLAILFAWRDIAKKRNSIDTNIIFFDEILDSSLDAEGVDSFIGIIKKLTSGTNCFIISHNENSIQKIENCIEFEKINGFSRIKGS